MLMLCKAFRNFCCGDCMEGDTESTKQRKKRQNDSDKEIRFRKSSPERLGEYLRKRTEKAKDARHQKGNSSPKLGSRSNRQHSKENMSYKGIMAHGGRPSRQQSRESINIRNSNQAHGGRGSRSRSRVFVEDRRYSNDNKRKISRHPSRESLNIRKKSAGKRGRLSRQSSRESLYDGRHTAARKRSRTSLSGREKPRGLSKHSYS